MKKWIAMLLVMCMTLSLFGCGSGEPKETQGAQQPGQTDNSSTQPPLEDNTTKQTQPAVENWGVECAKYIFAPDVTVYVSFPQYPGDEYGTGMYANQPDYTIAIYDIYKADGSAEVDEIKDLFPACGEQVKPMFDDAYGFAYDNSSIEAEYDGTETIGSYEVTKFRGVHHYTLEGEERNCQYVVYAVELNCCYYAYVMVQDISKDQSQLELIESHAYNMIRSMREE